MNKVTELDLNHFTVNSWETLIQEDPQNFHNFMVSNAPETNTKL